MDYQTIIEYRGEWIGLNEILALTYRARMKLLAEVKPLYVRLITEAKIPPLDTFTIWVRYRSRHDADGVLMKYFIDTLHHLGVTINDDNRYFHDVRQTVDKTLPFNTFLITISGTMASGPHSQKVKGTMTKVVKNTDVTKNSAKKTKKKREIGGKTRKL